MVEEAKEIENSESPAVRLVRLSYIERIGSLLSIMIGEDISPRKSIVKEFHVSYDTIRKFLNFDSKIKFDLNSATVSINRLSDSKLSLWCLGALFDCCISRDKPFHPLTPPSDLRQYAVENRQEIRISQSLY